MFDLTFLGTSASVPSADRNHPGLLVEAGGRRIMVDCGGGAHGPLVQSGAGFRRLDRLLLTHGHFDHVLGIPGLFSTLRLRQSSDLMTIHGGPGTLDVVVRMLAGLWGEGRAPIPLELIPLSEGQVFDAGEFTVDCFPVRHRDTDSFAFTFEARARRHLLPERLAALGVPDGPARGEVGAGRPGGLPGGRTIDPADVLGSPARGTKLVVVGDTDAQPEFRIMKSDRIFEFTVEDLGWEWGAPTIAEADVRTYGKMVGDRETGVAGIGKE